MEIKNNLRFPASVLGLALFGLMLAHLASCASSGPLRVLYEPGEPALRLKTPLKVVLFPFRDVRGVEDPRSIGRIEPDVTVGDIMTKRIVLDRALSALVTSAFREELEASGFKVLPGPEEGTGTEDADFTLGGEVRRFNLNVGPRNRISIEVFTVLRDVRTGRVVWSGVEKKEDERFAGVMGSSRRTIASYLVNSLADVVKKTLKEGMGAYLYRPLARPEMPVKGGDQGEAPGGTGLLVITTEPSRAKVYIGDIYYGLTPMRVELEPGIYELRLELRGYRDEGEKVAVRDGHVTELEVRFEK